MSSWEMGGRWKVCGWLMKVTIMDNVLPTNTADEIERFVGGSDFPWFYTPGIVFKNTSGYYFTHMLYVENRIYSDFFHLVEPLLAIIKPRSIYRIKVNLYPPTDTIVEHGLHVDYNWDDIHTAVYYVNTNDGYTGIEDGTKIDSIKNRLAILKPMVPHTSSTSTKTQRITINFNWF